MKKSNVPGVMSMFGFTFAGGKMRAEDWGATGVRGVPTPGLLPFSRRRPTRADVGFTCGSVQVNVRTFSAHPRDKGHTGGTDMYQCRFCTNNYEVIC